MKREELWNALNETNKKFVENYLKTDLKLDSDSMCDFLFPKFEIHNLEKMKDLEKSVERILQAIENEEMICIYGDYDCDGVPGVAMCKSFFEKINYKYVMYYIPHRHIEGYGLHKEAILEISKLNVKLLITLDLGTTNIPEIEYGNSLGIQTIVTDHHLPIEIEGLQKLPDAFAIINNKQHGCKFPDKNLCGTGTMWLLLYRLIETGREQSQVNKTLEKYFSEKVLPIGFEKWLLDLVAIATVADMVPLVGINRMFVIYGMIVLSKTKRAGLRELLKNGKVDFQNISEQDISFTIAPRINSASRMDHPITALKVLSNDLKEGIDGAHILEDLNFDRKKNVANITKKVYKEIDQKITNGTLGDVVVIGSHDFNIGVVGIVATNIVEKYKVNAFVWGHGNGEVESADEKNSEIGNEKKSSKILKGSCRGRGDTHVVELMTILKDEFIHFGGHEMSGGFAVSISKIHTLENLLNEKIASAKIEKREEKKKEPISIFLKQINKEFLVALTLIGPFGLGNEKPNFKIVDLVCSKFSRFGKSGEHLKIILSDGKEKREAVKFFVDETKEMELMESYKLGNLHFEIEPGFRTNIPRLKIV